MRDLRALWQDLEPKPFISFQALFLPRKLQFLFSPFFSIFWSVQFRLIHKSVFGLSAYATSALCKLFIFCFVTDFLLTLIWKPEAGQTRLWAWIPIKYFIYRLPRLPPSKAFYKEIRVPFYWEKNHHGFDTAKPDPP